MKTTTVRLDDDQVELLEALADLDNCTTSAVMRKAIGAYFKVRKDEDPGFATRIKGVGRRRLALRADDLRDTLGLTLDDLAEDGAIEQPTDTGSKDPAATTSRRAPRT